MAKKWIKLHRKLLLSKDLNLVANENSLAERLFYRMLLAADDYGRLPGDPWLLKAHTGPLLNNSEDEIASAVRCLEEHSLLDRYKVDGEDYLVLINYDRYQTTDWSKVGEAEHPPPPDWSTNPPASLVEFIEKHTDRRYFSLARYGLTSEVSLNGQPLRSTSDGAGGNPPDIDVDVDVDVDVDLEKGIRAESGAAPRKETPQQIAIESAWDAFGLGEPYGNAKGNKPGFSGLTQLVAEHGIPIIEAWTATVKRSPPARPPGAERWAWFKQQFRAAMKRQWEWDGSREEHRKKPSRELAEYQRQHGKELGLL